jgi:TRAP-type C4-dicarboxylate transport system substrate-binding protein
MMRRFLAGGAMVSVLLVAAVPDTHAEGEGATVLKIATLAPRKSLWGSVFEAWATAVASESNNRMQLSFDFATGIDEKDMFNNMQNLQTDGAAMTARGLSFIHPGPLVLQAGNIDSWDKVDNIRTALMARFATSFAEKNFSLVGSGDVGRAYVMSVGAPVRTPGDLAKRKTFYFDGDPIGKAFLGVVGAQNPLSLTVPAVYPALGTSTDVVISPALAAEQLQWSGKVNAINTRSTSFGVGGLVFFIGTGSKFAGLPEDLKEILRKTGDNTGKILTKKVRDQDKAAYERLTKKLEVYTPNDDESKQWADKAAETRNQVCGKVIPKDICDAAATAH